jgi:hypothetical protein
MSWMPSVQSGRRRVRAPTGLFLATCASTRERPPLGTRFHTGQRCVVSGAYAFVCYVDGTFEPPPTDGQRKIPLSEHETFPCLAGANKGAVWELIEYL